MGEEPYRLNRGVSNECAGKEVGGNWLTNHPVQCSILGLPENEPRLVRRD